MFPRNIQVVCDSSYNSESSTGQQVPHYQKQLREKEGWFLSRIIKSILPSDKIFSLLTAKFFFASINNYWHQNYFLPYLGFLLSDIPI